MTMTSNKRLLICLAVVAAVLLVAIDLAEGGVRLCDGFEDSPMQIVGGSFPDTVYIPSTFLFSTNMNLTADLPADLVLDLKLRKHDPFPITVPCLEKGLGSCIYDICYMIEHSLNETWCPQFPPHQPCGCPLLEGEMNLVDLEANVPDFGPVLNPIMEGFYDAEAKFYGTSSPDNVVGCIIFNFTFVQSNPSFF